jgi:hypothetical protein
VTAFVVATVVQMVRRTHGSGAAAMMSRPSNLTRGSQYLPLLLAVRDRNIPSMPSMNAVAAIEELPFFDIA